MICCTVLCSLVVFVHRTELNMNADPEVSNSVYGNTGTLTCLPGMSFMCVCVCVCVFPLRIE